MTVKNKKYTKKRVDDKLEKESWSDRKPIKTILVKVTVILIIVISLICYSDNKGVFNSDESNNHTIKKWDSFYDFSEQHSVDVLLVGNSHLYTGINPKNLSTGLGCNAFILASQGTEVDDHYYAIKEAIELNPPKLLILETYGLKK